MLPERQRQLMRKAVSLDNLAVGELLAQDIYDQDNNLLLRKGTVLLDALAEAFRKRGLLEIFVYNDTEAAVVEVEPEEFTVPEPQAIPHVEHEEQARNYAQVVVHYTRLIFEMRRAVLRGQYNKIMQDDLPESTGKLVQLFLNLDDNQMINFYLQVKEMYLDSQFEVHAVNVCMLASMLGLWTGLNEFEIRELAIAALLHDIGETQIPSGIFEKRCKLTESEWHVVKTHPLLGAKILNKNKWATPRMITAILRHHERLDGTGYPYSSPGTDIPVYARIIAAAGSLDAMTTNRPYRRAKSLFYALSELKERSFGQLDSLITRTLYEKILIHYQGQDVELSNGERGTIVGIDEASNSRRLLVKGDRGYYDMYQREAPAIRNLLEVMSF